MIRRVISVIATLTMICVLLPSAGFADENQEPTEKAGAVVCDEITEKTGEATISEDTSDTLNEEPANQDYLKQPSKESAKVKEADSQVTESETDSVQSEDLQKKDSENDNSVQDSSKESAQRGGNLIKGAYDEQYDEAEDFKDISNYSFHLAKTKFFYNGYAKTPRVICSDPSLREGVDYYVNYFTEEKYEKVYGDQYDLYDEETGEWYDWQVNYCEPTSPGLHYVEIYGYGNYTGVVQLYYSILQTNIVLNRSVATLYRTGTAQINVAVSNPNGKTTFTSSNPKVAAVTSGGKITARSKGTAIITVKNGYAWKTVTVAVKNPSLNLKKSSSIHIGQKVRLKITGKIGNATFRSSNNKVASVSKKGVIKAKKKGKCTIYVKTNGITLKCVVTVRPPALSKSRAKVYNSDSLKLKVLGGKGKIKWKSSNSSIATVSKKGVVRGKKAGKCIITAKRGKYTMKCKVTVPSQYEGYTVPDFGAVYGKKVKQWDQEDSFYTCIYKASKSYVNRYERLLKRKGFVFYQRSKGTNIYINNSWDVVGVMYSKGFVCVVYGNLLDSMDDDGDE